MNPAVAEQERRLGDLEGLLGKKEAKIALL